MKPVELSQPISKKSENYEKRVISAIGNWYLRNEINEQQAGLMIDSAFSKKTSLLGELIIAKSVHEKNEKTVALAKKYFQSLINNFSISPQTRLEAQIRINEIDLLSKIYIKDQFPDQDQLIKFKNQNLQMIGFLLPRLINYQGNKEDNQFINNDNFQPIFDLFNQLIFETLINYCYLKDPTKNLIAIRSIFDHNFYGNFLDALVATININLFNQDLDIQNQIQLITEFNPQKIELFRNYHNIQLISFNKIAKLDSSDIEPIYQIASELIKASSKDDINNAINLKRRYSKIIGYLYHPSSQLIN